VRALGCLLIRHYTPSFRTPRLFVTNRVTHDVAPLPARPRQLEGIPWTCRSRRLRHSDNCIQLSKPRFVAKSRPLKVFSVIQPRELTAPSVDKLILCRYLDGRMLSPSTAENTLTNGNMPAVVSEMSHAMDRTIEKSPVIHSQSIIGAKPICIIEWLVFNDSQESGFVRDEPKISCRRVL
jgi:hypothetical protein